MFLHMSVCPRGGGDWCCEGGDTMNRGGAALGGMLSIIGSDIASPPHSGQHHSPSVNKRAVRILLECFLVLIVIL